MIDVLGTRDRIVDTGICTNGQAEPFAVLLDDLFVQVLDDYVQESTLEALIEQWRLERAEMALEQAQFMAAIRKEISDFREESNQRERERDQREQARERERDERERQRDERERQRDERERQRIRDQDERDAKLRQWVIGVVGLGFAATTLVTGLLVAFG